MLIDTVEVPSRSSGGEIIEHDSVEVVGIVVGQVCEINIDDRNGSCLCFCHVVNINEVSRNAVGIKIKTGRRRIIKSRNSKRRGPHSLLSQGNGPGGGGDIKVGSIDGVGTKSDACIPPCSDVNSYFIALGIGRSKVGNIQGVDLVRRSTLISACHTKIQGAVDI